MTTTALERRPVASVVAFTEAQVETLRTTLCSDLTDPELDLFLAICTQQGLDPFRREIYATKTKSNRKVNGAWVEEWKLTPIASIDAFRSKAQETGAYAGQQPPQWTADGKTWVDVWLEPRPPAACRVSVLRHDWAEPLTVTYTWQEYSGGNPSKMQSKMPAHMLAKATEALALRKAFPRTLGGIYTSEEMAGVPKRIAGEVEIVREESAPTSAAAESPKRVVARRRPTPSATPAVETPAPDETDAAPVVDVVTPERYSEVGHRVKLLDGEERSVLGQWAKTQGIQWLPDTMTVEMADAIVAKVAELLPVDEAEEPALEGEIEEPAEEPAPVDEVQAVAEAFDATLVDAATEQKKFTPPPNPAASRVAQRRPVPTPSTTA